MNIETLAHMDIDRARRILRDAAVAWDKPNPFSVGDIIKPHSGMWTRRLDLALVKCIYPRHSLEPDDSYRIVTHDMRILAIGDGGAVGEFIADSRDFVLVEAAA